MLLSYKKYGVLITAFIFAFPSIAQVGKMIDPRFLLREYDAITRHLTETHPALYRFVSKDSLDFFIHHQRAQIAGPMDQLAFYRLVSPIFAAVGDGHTKILIDEELFEKVLSRKGIFPYEVWLDDDDRMYIVDAHLDKPQISIGSEIVSINGVPVAQFISSSEKFVGYEHKNYRNSVISDNFSWLMALTQDFDHTIEIEIDPHNAKKIYVDMMPFKKWKRRNRKMNKKKLKRRVEFENNEYRNLGDQVGYLKIHEFESHDIARYIDNIKAIFSRIKDEQITSLVIDLRDNSGGDPKYVEALIHTISDIPFCRTEMMYQIKKGRPNSYYRLLGNTKSGLVRFASNHMVFSGNEDAHREPITFENEYEGDIYVLVNEKSYSAAATLASVIKCYDLGVIVGNMTGGTRIFQAYNLTKNHPRSRFTSTVSSTMIYTSCSGFEDEHGYREGIVPDIVIETTLADRLQKKDNQLSYVLELIQEGGYGKTYD